MTFKKVLYSILTVICIILLVIYIKIASSEIENNSCKIQNIENLDNVNFRDYKSVKINASNAYEGDMLKNALQGKNYRNAWSTEIEAPVLYLDTLYGGAEILKVGGGTQTKSLRLQSKNGLILTLRSINKDPEPLVPETVKTLGLENIVMDGISGQHPYAALPVAKLADAVGILHTHPKVVFLPKQEILGKTYNTDFGNRLYLLEYENKGSVNWSNYDSIEIIADNDDLQKFNSSKNFRIRIDKKLLIRSRLFDLVIGDWDRHAKQWGWLLQKNSDSLFTAIPFPTDRDNAFFNVEGLIPTLISNKNITPHLQSFENEPQLDGLVYDFDVYYLQNTTFEDFSEQARLIQKLLTDKKIENAFKVWNKELMNFDGKAIIKQIKKRRDNLIKLSQKFKTILDSTPLLNMPLKGSDLEDTPNTSMQCFEC